MKVTFTLFAAFAAAVIAQDAVTATRSDACEPHGDHWHCPSGVSEPTTPPAAVVTPSASGTITPAASASASAHDDDDDHDHSHAVSATTCEPHGNHWHCPSGVAQPATPPAMSTTRAPNGTVPNASASAPSVSQATGAAGEVGAGAGAALALMGAVGAYFL